MYMILVSPDRSGRRVGEIHISQKSHDEMIHELLTHPVRPLPLYKLLSCFRHRVTSIDEAHEFAHEMAAAFWICWCDDPSQYCAPTLQPCNSLIAR